MKLLIKRAGIVLFKMCYLHICAVLDRLGNAHGFACRKQDIFAVYIGAKVGRGRVVDVLAVCREAEGAVCADIAVQFAVGHIPNVRTVAKLFAKIFKDLEAVFKFVGVSPEVENARADAPRMFPIVIFEECVDERMDFRRRMVAGRMPEEKILWQAERVCFLNCACITDPAGEGGFGDMRIGKTEWICHAVDDLTADFFKCEAVGEDLVDSRARGQIFQMWMRGGVDSDLMPCVERGNFLLRNTAVTSKKLGIEVKCTLDVVLIEDRDHLMVKHCPIVVAECQHFRAKVGKTHGNFCHGVPPCVKCARSAEKERDRVFLRMRLG